MAAAGRVGGQLPLLFGYAPLPGGSIPELGELVKLAVEVMRNVAGIYPTGSDGYGHDPRRPHLNKDFLEWLVDKFPIDPNSSAADDIRSFDIPVPGRGSTSWGGGGHKNLCFWRQGHSGFHPLQNPFRSSETPFPWKSFCEMVNEIRTAFANGAELYTVILSEREFFILFYPTFS